VFLTLVAGAGGFTAGQELLDAGGAQEFWRRVQLQQEGLPALAQGESRFGDEVRIS